MNIRAKASSGTAPATIAPQEWSARVDLAAVYRLVAHHGWDDVIYNRGGSADGPRQAPTFSAR